MEIAQPKYFYRGVFKTRFPGYFGGQGSPNFTHVHFEVCLTVYFRLMSPSFAQRRIYYFSLKRVSPFCLPISADVSIFTRNFYPFPRGKPWSTRKRQTGVFCLLFVGRFNGKKLQHVTQINNAHMLVKLFNNLWRTSTAKVAIL